jgi:hypothetical protein
VAWRLVAQGQADRATWAAMICRDRRDQRLLLSCTKDHKRVSTIYHQLDWAPAPFDRSESATHLPGDSRAAESLNWYLRDKLADGTSWDYMIFVFNLNLINRISINLVAAAAVGLPSTKQIGNAMAERPSSVCSDQLASRRHTVAVE